MARQRPDFPWKQLPKNALVGWAGLYKLVPKSDAAKLSKAELVEMLEAFDEKEAKGKAGTKPRKPRKAPRYLEIVEVATLRQDEEALRAVVTWFPGGADELRIEDLRFGDEAEPFAIEADVEVLTGAVNRVSDLRWNGRTLTFTVDEGATGSVTVSPETFAKKSIKATKTAASKHRTD